MPRIVQGGRNVEPVPRIPGPQPIQTEVSFAVKIVQGERSTKLVPCIPGPSLSERKYPKFRKGTKKHLLDECDCEKSLSLPKICGDPVCGSPDYVGVRPGRCCVRCRWVKFVFMITLDTIRKPVTAELEAFDEFVDRQFTAEGELLADMLRYALSSRGKGIRPLLVMLSAAMNSPVRARPKGGGCIWPRCSWR